MKKPTVYLDTSFISAYWYEGADVSMISRRLKTRDWWRAERPNFAVWASAFGDTELSAGDFPRQDDCVRMVRRLPYLAQSAACDRLIEELLRQQIIPPNQQADAGHLAIATVSGIDYLVTWNYAHLANPLVQSRLDRLCVQKQCFAPLLVSPESIPQFRYGQTIWRKKRS